MAAVLWLVVPSAAQPLQRFEVAVIHPHTAPADSGASFELFPGGRIKIVNEPVKLLIRTAFHVPNPQIAGDPSWVETDPYDIEAKTGRPEKPTPDQLGPMLQNLLAERFRFQFHRETRELSVLALVVTKGGPKMKPKQEDETPGMNTHAGHGVSQLIATGSTMDLFAAYVGNRLGRIVIDKTGLTGSYDFTLEWAPEQGSDSPAPSLVTALQEQLGLRLESRKSPMEVLVIDRIERPSDN